MTVASELTFYNRKSETHLTPAFLCAMGGVIGTPFSTAFSMLKAARTETTATKIIMSAAWLPGHILRGLVEGWRMIQRVKTYRRPKPNAMVWGSCSAGFVDVAMWRSGLNSSGLG